MALLLPTVAVETLLDITPELLASMGVDTVLWMWTILWLITAPRNLSQGRSNGRMNCAAEVFV